MMFLLQSLKQKSDKMMLEGLKTKQVLVFEKMLIAIQHDTARLRQQILKAFHTFTQQLS